MESENAKRGRSSVARNAGIVSLAVMASRVLGLVRDQVFAIFFGAGLYYDAFLTAFRIPNLLRDLFAEGALSAAFVTTFSQVLATKGEEEAIRLSNRVATLMISRDHGHFVGRMVARAGHRPYACAWFL